MPARPGTCVRAKKEVYCGMKRVTLEDFAVRIELPVQWSDMDAAQHVNNVSYLRWVESARLAYFERMNMDTTFAGDAPGPILGWQDCKYVFPMTYPDTAILGIRTTEVADDHLMMQCAVFSKRHERLAALAQQRIVPYAFRSLRKLPVPETWRRGVGEIEGSD